MELRLAGVARSELETEESESAHSSNRSMAQAWQGGISAEEFGNGGANAYRMPETDQPQQYV